MKDILDSLNDMFDSLYDSVNGRAGSARDSGDPEFDRAWQDLDDYLGTKAGAASAFQELDRDFAEFDRRFAAAGGSPRAGGSFEDLKARAGAEAERQARERERSQSRQSQQGGQTADQEDPLLVQARELVRDYHNLEITPGAKIDEVKSAYKRLLKQYHPDRFANEPAKQSTATQITARLNQSYARIMTHLGGR